MNSGKLLTGIIVGVALVAASVAWTFQSNRGQRALALWGGQNAYLIRHAPRVELLLANRDPPQAIDISRTRGLAHARQALIEDRSFVWSDGDRPAGFDAGGQPNWQYTLRFVEADSVLTVRLDLDQRWAQVGPAGAHVRMSEKLAGGLQVFLGELVEVAAGQPDEPSPSAVNTDRAPL